VSPRAGLDNVEKRKLLTLPGLELRPLGRPARRQLLYRLRYTGSRNEGITAQILTLTLDGGVWSASLRRQFIPGERALIG
jgi:hypothetical protein